MARSYKRDTQGQFASGGSSTSKAKSAKASAAKSAPTPKAAAAKPSAGKASAGKASAGKSSAAKSAPRPASKSAASKWAEKSGGFGAKLGNALVSPERQELRRKNRIADEQMHREIGKRDKQQGEDRPVDPFMPDRDLWDKRDKQRAKAKEDFRAARAARRGKKP